MVLTEQHTIFWSNDYMNEQMLESGESIFGCRKSNYQNASESFEKIRCSELEVIGNCLKDKLHPLQKEALELGSGTGFLTTYLSHLGFTVDTSDYEFEKPFHARSFEKCNLRENFPFLAKKQSYDLIVSLASLHHVAERNLGTLPTAFCLGACNALKDDGIVLIVDVAPGNEDTLADAFPADKVGVFFKEVIDRYAHPTHDGRYLNGDLVQQQFRQLGLLETEHSYIDCAWYFDTEEQMAVFVKSLFNLKALPVQKVKEYLKTIIGCESNGRLQLNWGLQIITASKPRD
jgi:SAM-dependent methyltransferase